MLNRTLGAED